MTLVFGAVALLGAGLLFVVQPLVARILLPYYGGSPTVWTTSALFFQTALLAGYALAHVSTVRLGPRRHPWVQSGLLLAPLLVLPLALPDDPAPPAGAEPVWWLLRTLAVVIGLPFLVLATSGPTIQRWFSWTQHRRSTDPYFLYAISNVGSFAGLLAYPFVIEPLLTLRQQERAWSWGYLLFAALSLVAAVLVRRRSSPADVDAVRPSADREESVPWPRRLRWVFWAFVPSSLMLGATTYITTDVAAVPLLWVVPLAIYLGTYVVAFARTTREPPRRALWVGAAVAVLALLVIQFSAAFPILLLFTVHLGVVAAVGFAAHASLAADRPAPAHLTQFYLIMAVGGALGGLLNGVLAPLLLPGPWEYPIVLALTPLIALPALRGARLGLTRLTRAPFRLAASLVSIVAAMGGIAWALAGGPPVLGALVAFLGVLLVLSTLLTRPAVLAGALTAAVLAGIVLGPDRLFVDRTFFGSYAVVAVDDQHRLLHGTTLHGAQIWDPDPRLEPTTYYSRSGPLGDVFEFYGPGIDEGTFVGLGVGTAASFGQPGQVFRFVEIDALVEQIAREEDLFTFLAGSDADVEVTIADGRLAVADQPVASNDLIVLDAFTSDAIPVHLLTREAFRTYASRLTADGVLAVHISNRHLDLRPVLASAARDLGITAVAATREPEEEGATPAAWVVLDPDAARAETFVREFGWERLAGEGVEWTDDYAPIVTVWDGGLGD